MDKLLKEKKWKEIYNLLKKDKENTIDINISYNNIYLIQYVIIYEQNDLLQLLIDKECNIDVTDIDKRTLIHYVIKFNNLKTLKKLLDYNNIYIGMSLLNIQDKDGNTALHYSIILNNYDTTKEILKYNVNLKLRNNNSYTPFHLAIYQKNIDIIKLFLEKDILNKIDINSRINTGETVLHIATNFQNYEICNLLVKNNINLNLKDFDYEYTALNYAIILNNTKIIKLFLENNVNINDQDYYGNSFLHYIILENNKELFNLFKSKKMNVNIYNIDNKIPLHIALEKNLDYYIDYLLDESNLNFQNNFGNTILHLLAINDKYKMYKYKLEKKKLDIFIKNKKGYSPYDICKNKEDFIDLACKSFIYILQNKNFSWKFEWERICSKKDFDKAKLFKLTKKDKCYDVVKDFILQNKISVPVKDKEPLKLNIENKCIKYTTFRGLSIDILVGLLYLYKKYDNVCKLISTDFIKNESIEKYYKKLNFKLSKINYLNFQILFLYNNIFFPTYFDSLIKKCLDSNKKFIIIPLGIEISEGSHSNYIIYDMEKKEVERYEPNGSHNPFRFNYNYILLDNLLKKKFMDFDSKIKYFSPIDYLPKISFQLLDSIETKKNKKIGDPDGFCAAWTVWYVDMRLNNSSYSRDNLVYKIIKKIKKFNYSFKQIVRNYTINITNFRDKILDKAEIEINDYINNNFSTNQLNIINNELDNLITNVINNKKKQNRITVNSFKWS